MSLFKTKNIWTASTEDDLYDLGCLKVANIGVNKSNFNSIITGSYNGFLRIFNPIVRKENEQKGFKDDEEKIGFVRSHDLVCEISFPAPIIQIETGRFVSTSSKQHIAILMPKKLAIYEAITIENGSVEHGDQFKLKFVYEHALQRNAYNMCKGSFGGVSNHEYICVQSMDGMLSIFEYESFSLSCFLPKVLLPGPIKYFKKTDSFITISSSWVLESYKYQVLAMSGKSNYESSSKAKRILAEYSFNLGEPIIDIDLVEQPSTTILVLGERNLFCLSENFTLRFMKKFDYNPSSFCVYPILSSTNAINSNSSVNFITATHSKVLFIHEDVRVKWAAQVDYVPVQIAVAKINDLQGVIVCLSEDGKLNCCYLGTEPALLNPISVREEKQFNFESAETEYRSLQAKIKSSIMNTGAVLGNIANSGLVISVDVPSKLDAITPMTRLKDTELKDPIDAIPSITCKLTLKSVETVQNVKVIIQCNLPLVAVPDTIVYSSIGSVPFEQEICFYAKTKHIPMSLNVTVCASYLYSINSVPKVSEARFRLPLKLVMKSGVQQSSTSSSQKQEESKTSDQKKITIETNKPCVNLTELFPEFSASYIASNGNIIAAQFYGHNHMNVLVQAAKSGANRYRIQSDSYDSLWLIAQEFVSRLQTHFSKQSQDVSIIYKESLPMDDYRQLIDKHLELRQKTEGYKELIENYSVQFRAIQKRLLIKFKDKNPTSLDNMDALLEATYRQIVTLSDNYLNTYRELSLLSNSLNCMSRLFVLLMSLAFHLNKESVQVLESIMSIQVNDTSELGWEEIVNAGMANLLRNALSKSSSKDASQQVVSQLKIPNDSSRLEKQFKSLVSKFESGANLLSNVYLNKDSYKSYEETTTSNQMTNEKKKESRMQNETDVVKEEKRVPVKKPPVIKNRLTMGEEYEETSTEQPPQSKEPQPNVYSRNQMGMRNLPTFEELMAAEEKGKGADIKKLIGDIENDFNDDEI